MNGAAVRRQVERQIDEMPEVRTPTAALGLTFCIGPSGPADEIWLGERVRVLLKKPSGFCLGFRCH